MGKRWRRYKKNIKHSDRVSDIFRSTTPVAAAAWRHELKWMVLNTSDTCFCSMSMQGWEYGLQSCVCRCVYVVCICFHDWLCDRAIHLTQVSEPLNEGKSQNKKCWFGPGPRLWRMPEGTTEREREREREQEMKRSRETEKEIMRMLHWQRHIQQK